MHHPEGSDFPQNIFFAWHLWLIPVILATYEAEIKRIEVQS
jgi:hypothetical protein